MESWNLVQCPSAQVPQQKMDLSGKTQRASRYRVVRGPAVTSAAQRTQGVRSMRSRLEGSSRESAALPARARAE